MGPKTARRPKSQQENIEPMDIDDRNKNSEEVITSEAAIKPIIKENEIFESFKDETNAVNASAADCYFLQGKLPSMNNRRRKRKGKHSKRGETKVERSTDESDEEEENDEENSKFTEGDLTSLRNYFEKSVQLAPKSMLQLRESIRDNFPRWKVYISMNFNILMHGVGSLRNVTRDFVKSVKNEVPILHFDGCHEQISAKLILEEINRRLSLNCSSFRKSVDEFAAAIVLKMEQRGKNNALLIVIDSIDGTGLRDSCAQDALCMLAKCKTINIVASINHINATSLWNTCQLSGFCWYFERVDTYEDHREEILAGQSRVLGLNTKVNQLSHTISSLDVFWQSLAENARKIFCLYFSLYARSQHAVLFWDLFEAARDAFLVSSDAVLHTQLVEFQDHRLISVRRRDDGNEMLHPSIDIELVSKFLSEKGLSLD